MTTNGKTNGNGAIPNGAHPVIEGALAPFMKRNAHATMTDAQAYVKAMCATDPAFADALVREHVAHVVRHALAERHAL